MGYTNKILIYHENINNRIKQDIRILLIFHGSI